jgi:hypothetical protein
VSTTHDIGWVSEETGKLVRLRLGNVHYGHRAMHGDVELRALLVTLDVKARDDLRRVLIRDQADRDAISSRLMRYRHQNGQDWADIIDFLTMYPNARRQVVRLLGEMSVGERDRGGLLERVADPQRTRNTVRNCNALRCRHEGRRPRSWSCCWTHRDRAHVVRDPDGR